MLNGLSSSEYTKGEILDGVYTNEWAEISFEVTSEWPEGTAADYAEYNGDGTECGFISYIEDEGR